VLRREQEQVELRGSAIVRTTWRVLADLHRLCATGLDLEMLGGGAHHCWVCDGLSFPRAEHEF